MPKTKLPQVPEDGIADGVYIVMDDNFGPTMRASFADVGQVLERIFLDGYIPGDGLLVRMLGNQPVEQRESWAAESGALANLFGAPIRELKELAKRGHE